MVRADADIVWDRNTQSKPELPFRIPNSAFRIPHSMYIELHCHSAFSFLDGASLPEQLALTASQLGYAGLALTDHNGLYGSLAFAHEAKQLALQAISGADLTLRDGSHVTLLAETPDGYANLCRVISEAHLGSADRRDPRLDFASLGARHAGLIVLCGGRTASSTCGRPRKSPNCSRTVPMLSPTRSRSPSAAGRSTSPGTWVTAFRTSAGPTGRPPRRRSPSCAVPASTSAIRRAPSPGARRSGGSRKS